MTQPGLDRMLWTESVLLAGALATMACASFGFCFVSGVAPFRTFLLVKVLCTAGALPSSLIHPLLGLLLLSALVMEIAIYEAFFVNLIVSLCVAAISIPTLAQTLSPDLISLSRTATVLLLSGAYVPLAVSWCLLTHYRERSIDQDEAISRLSRAVNEIARANLGYQSYANQAEARSQLQERQRITRDLHDVVGHTFLNNIMMLEAAVSKIHKDPERVEQLIQMARQNAESGLKSIRQSLYLLRSYEQPRMSSIQRIHRMVEIFGVATGVKVKAEYANAPQQLPPEVEGFLYSFIQEALVNALRHGQATRVRVYLFETEGRLVASVLDNGRGADEVREGIGITGMRERLAKLGGALAVTCRSSGFEITAELPCEEGRSA